MVHQCRAWQNQHLVHLYEMHVELCLYVWGSLHGEGLLVSLGFLEALISE